jgi:transcriptional regulator with XRE-family HTH domain
MSKTFGETLRTLRENKHITRDQLSKDTGVSITALYYYEKDQKTPSIDILRSLAKSLNVSADYLLGLTDNPLNENNEMPDFIKNKLNKLENLETQNLPDKLEQIAKELLNISKKLKNI